MKASQNAVERIKKYEGFSSKPYLCPAGKATIGYGSTFYPDGKKVTLKDKAITKDEGEVLLRETIKTFEKILEKRLTVSVSQNQYDAVLSHTFNTGGSDTLFKLINEKKFKDAATWIKTRYTTSNGKVLKGLVARRNEEYELFIS
ncbi:MAG: hypothetical protein BGO29_14740 [Bacteroidales bacterium 36-12]|nr:MAG: hypothetical protein BGO29_14740 [Bacteroidales bacterium 36-12]